MNKHFSYTMRQMSWLVPLLIAAQASAHHSFSGYDMTKTSTAHATIKELRWGAPHSAVVFTIKGNDGTPENITLASAAPAMYFRQGFVPKDFKVGDKVDIAWHPTRSGQLGGFLASLTLPDGRTFKDGEISKAGLADSARQAADAQ